MIVKIYGVHTLIKFQRFGEFVKLTIASHLLAPPPPRDMVFNEGVLSGSVGAYLPRASHL